MLASVNAHYRLVDLLIANGASTDKQMRGTGITALMLAAGAGHADITKRLLLAGAKPLLRDAKGNTALDLATQKGHVSACRRWRSWRTIRPCHSRRAGGWLDAAPLVARRGSGTRRSRPRTRATPSP